MTRARCAATDCREYVYVSIVCAEHLRQGTENRLAEAVARVEETERRADALRAAVRTTLPMFHARMHGERMPLLTCESPKCRKYRRLAGLDSGLTEEAL